GRGSKYFARFLSLLPQGWGGCERGLWGAMLQSLGNSRSHVDAYSHDKAWPADDRRRIKREETRSSRAPEPVEEAETWAPVIRKLGLSRATVIATIERAHRNRTSFQSELLALSVVAEASFFAAVADTLQLGIVKRVEAEELVLNDRTAPALLR